MNYVRFLIIFFFCPFSLHAKEEILLSQYELSQKNLKKQQLLCNNLENELQNLSEKIVFLENESLILFQKIKDNEENLKRYNADIEAVENKIKKLKGKKKDLYKDQAEFITLALRLSKMPPQLLLGANKNPQETIIGLTYLKICLTDLSTKLQKYQKNRKKLEKSKLSLRQTKSILANEKTLLEEKRLELKEKLDEGLYLRQEKESLISSEKKQLQKILSELSSLKELLKALEERKNDSSQEVKEQNLVCPEKGKMTLPVRGKILNYFNEEDLEGHVNRGIRFAVSPSENVIAPFDGRIAFCGPFRNYSNIVIIEHGKGYHSLLMGLGKVNISTGQWIKAGEILGTSSVKEQNEGQNNAQPVLFMEFRHHLQPIDPLPWFKK